jgi:hypothetical protein
MHNYVSVVEKVDVFLPPVPATLPHLLDVLEEDMQQLTERLDGCGVRTPVDLIELLKASALAESYSPGLGRFCPGLQGLGFNTHEALLIVCAVQPWL